jgi:hypothetical protein
MSFSESIVGYLDVRNAILRVGKMHVDSVVGGVDSSTNIFTRNSVLLWDRQESVDNPPFTLTSATRSTSPPEITLTGGSASAGLKLPNSWVCAFDLYGSDSLKMHVYTTSETTNVNGYELVFNNGSGVTLNYDGVGQVATASHTWTAAEWNRVVVGFERGAWTVSINGTPVLVFDDDERSAIYDDVGQFFRLDASGASSTTKIRYVKILTDGKWLQSNVGTLSYAQGNVVIGGDATEFKLDVRGTANVGTLTATSISMDEATHAVNTSTGAIVIANGGLGVASNVHGDNVFAASHLAVGTTATSYNFEVSGTSNMDSLTAESVDVTEATHSTSKDTGALIVTQGGLGVESNIHGTNVFAASHLGVGTTATSHALDINGTANFQSNVYAPNLQVAPTAANLVTWNSSTGDFMDSGGLISNKLAIVSEQPPAALTAATTTVDGHGKYTVSASSLDTDSNAWNAFDQSASVTWSSETGVYNTGTGAYEGSDSLGGASGEYLKITFPYKTTLRHFVYTGQSGAYTSWANEAKMFGSNDDSTWTELASFTAFGPTTDAPKTTVVDATSSYKHYGFVITTNNNASYATAAKLQLFTETFSVDAGVVSTTAASGLDVGYTEHPVEAMTDYKTYVEGHGTYEASASSYITNHEPWEPYNKIRGNPRWITPTNLYNSDGTYAGSITTTDVGGVRYSGEWNQLKIPYATIVSSIDFYPTGTVLSRSPVAGVVLGSCDGEHWYKLTEFSGKTYTNNVATKIDVNATTPYQYYRIVVSNVGTSPYEGKCELNEIYYFAEKPVTRMENVHISGDLSSETLQTGYIKWPKVPLKAAESEGYVASASSVIFNQSNYAGWHAFEDKTEYIDAYAPSWASGKWTFVNTTGLPDTANCATFDGISCEWLNIKCPQKFALSHFTISERKNIENNTYGPKDGYLYATNDGVQWTRLKEFTGLTYSNGDLPTRVDVQSSEPFSEYRLLVTKVGAIEICVINELQLFEAATGVGAAPTSAKLQVAGSLGMAKGSEFFAGDDVVMELPKHDRPLVKYPEVAMTAATTAGYVASASTEYNTTDRAAFNAFRPDTLVSESWFSGGGKYDADGTTSASAATFQGESGEYIKLELPKKIKLSHVKFTAIDATINYRTPPRKGIIWGSNDDVSWSQIHTFDVGELEANQIVQINVNTDTHYKYIVLQATEIGGDNGLARYVRIRQLQYYGYEEGDTSVDVVHRSIPNKPGQQHLEVYWDANDSNSYSFADSSNVYDLSGSGVTGAITGTNGFDAEYNAWVFDGSGDYISTTHNLGTGGQPVHSMSIWFKNVDPNPNYVYVAALGGAGYAQQSTIQLVNDKIRYTKRDYAHEANNSFVNNTWVHVVTTYSGGDFTQGNCKLYIDGVEAAVTSSGTGTPSTFTVATNSLYLGARTDGSGGQFDGSIANFRLFSKALSADQIRELYEYDAPRFGHRQNLVSLHKGNLGVGVAHPTSRFEVAGADGLQEYPPRGMTGYETYMEGHGVFRASASTVRNQTLTNAGNAAWHAFDSEAINTYWININDDDDYKYAGTSNTYSGISQLSPETPLGEYITLECPYKIIPQMVGFKPYDNLNHQPLNAVVYGSNDGYTWTFISSLQNMSGYSTSYIKTFSLNNTSKEGYRYVSFITTQVTGTSPYLRFFTYRIYGTPAPSSLEDGHLTLGKALTLPRVSGHPAGVETPRAESLVVHYDTTVDSVVSGTTVVDISGEGSNGTLNNGAAYSSRDRSLNLDATGDSITIGNIGNQAGAWVHSVSFWIYFLDLTSDRVFEVYGSAQDKIPHFVLESDGDVRWDFYSSNIKTTSQPIAPGIWYHVALSYNGGVHGLTNSKIYINGVSSASEDNGSGNALNIDANRTFFIGVGTKQRISNFKIWGGVALTAEEVAMEYALGRTGKSLNLTDTSPVLGWDGAEGAVGCAGDCEV